MDYETGVIIAFWWAVLSLVYNLFSRLGTLNQNMRKVGLRMSLVTGEFQEGGSLFGEFVLWIFLTIIECLLSWVGVALGVLSSIYFWHKRSGAPPVLKEFRWKARNVSMSKEVLQAEWAKVQASLFGKPPVNDGPQSPPDRGPPVPFVPPSRPSGPQPTAEMQEFDRLRRRYGFVPCAGCRGVEPSDFCAACASNYRFMKKGVLPDTGLFAPIETKDFRPCAECVPRLPIDFCRACAVAYRASGTIWRPA